MWDYGRHFCLINGCRVYVSFCFPEGWLKGRETFHVAVVFICVSHTRYCCWFICSSPHQMGSHVGRYRGYICMMFLPDLHAKIGFSWHHPLLLSSLPLKYHLYIISFQLFLFQLVPSPDDMSRWLWIYRRRAGHSAISFSPVDRLVPTFMRGNCLPLFLSKRRDNAGKVPNSILFGQVCLCRTFYYPIIYLASYIWHAQYVNMLEMQILRLTTLLDAPPTAKESSKVSYNIDFIWFHVKWMLYGRQIFITCSV